MISQHRHFQRLDELWATIARLERQVVEYERDALSMAGSESEGNARVARELAARAELERLRREHGILAQFLVTSMRELVAAA